MGGGLFHSVHENLPPYKSIVARYLGSRTRRGRQECQATHLMTLGVVTVDANRIVEVCSDDVVWRDICHKQQATRNQASVCNKSNDRLARHCPRSR